MASPRVPTWRISEQVHYLIEHLPELGGSQAVLAGSLEGAGCRRANDILRKPDNKSPARKATADEIRHLSDAIREITGLRFAPQWFQADAGTFRTQAAALIQGRESLIPRIPEMHLLRQPAASAGLSVAVGDRWIKEWRCPMLRFGNADPPDTLNRPPPPGIPADARNICTEFRAMGTWLDQPANRHARSLRLMAFMLVPRWLDVGEKQKTQGLFIAPSRPFGTQVNNRDISDLRHGWATGRPEHDGVLVFNRGTGRIPYGTSLQGCDCEIYFIWTTEHIPAFDRAWDQISFTVDDLQALLEELKRIEGRWTCDHLDFRVGPLTARGGG